MGLFDSLSDFGTDFDTKQLSEKVPDSKKVVDGLSGLNKDKLNGLIKDAPTDKLLEKIGTNQALLDKVGLTKDKISDSVPDPSALLGKLGGLDPSKLKDMGLDPSALVSKLGLSIDKLPSLGIDLKSISDSLGNIDTKKLLSSLSSLDPSKLSIAMPNLNPGNLIGDLGLSDIKWPDLGIDLKGISMTSLDPSKLLDGLKGIKNPLDSLGIDGSNLLKGLGIDTSKLISVGLDLSKLSSLKLSGDQIDFAKFVLNANENIKALGDIKSFYSSKIAGLENIFFISDKLKEQFSAINAKSTTLKTITNPSHSIDTMTFF